MTFYPGTQCEDTEITITFTANARITTNEDIKIELAGFTRGNCENQRGSDQNLGSFMLHPSTEWAAFFVEGQVWNEFHDSFLKLFPLKPIEMFEPVTIVIDASNGIRPNCGIPADWPLFRIQSPEELFDTQAFNATDPINGTCYVTDSVIEFNTGRIRDDTQIKVAFTPAANLGPKTLVKVQLPGFVHGSDIPWGEVRLTDNGLIYPPNATQHAPWKDFSKWNGTWTEGCCYEQDKHGYGNSTLTLELKEGYNLIAGDLTEVWVAYENNIQAQCSMRANDEARTITIIPNRTNENDWLFPASFSFGYEDGLDDDRVSLLFDGRFSHDAQVKRGVSHAPFKKSDAIGAGCRDVNFCSGHGKCDYCLEKCTCDDNYGAPRETRAGVVMGLRDCSERTCPLGRDWGARAWERPNRTAMPSSDGALFSYDLEDDTFGRFQQLHRDDDDAFDDDATVYGDDLLPKLAYEAGSWDAELRHGQLSECSGRGACSRKGGTCSCETGFAGRACERALCPGGIGEFGACSGHGLCLPMRDLVLRDDALPLSLAPLANDDGVSPPAEYFGQDYNAAPRPHTAVDVWESNTLHACVCESSWPVGLRANETQQSEYFGADCSMRHCPSGDDPMTSVDETNCHNKVAEGGRGIGQLGNKCHVDCSNRGVCDYLFGTCACLPGFHGDNCARVDVLALGTVL